MTTAGQPEIQPDDPPGRNTQKATLSVMWGGVWVPIGDAEFLTDTNNQIVKVISFTPKPFASG